MNVLLKVVCVLGFSVVMAGCSTWSTSHVEPATGAKEVYKVSKTTTPDKVILTTGNITNRKYKVIGDISATVRKTTIFNSNPTNEQVNEKLKEKAAELGADAVIMVTYGDKGSSFVSWSSLNGRGRAIVFTD